MPDAFDQDAYWIARHRRFGDDPRAVGNAGKSVEENLVGSARLQESLAAALRVIGLPGSVLDIGCGYGRLAPVFCDAGFDYNGIDVSSDAITAAKRHEPRGGFRAGSALTTDWGGPFDLISVIYVFVHFVDDPSWEALLDKISHHLRPGGGLLFADDFPAQAVSSVRHAKARSLDQYRAVFARVGLALDDEFPRQLATVMQGRAASPFAFARKID